MRPYQLRYLEMLRAASGNVGPSARGQSPETLATALLQVNRARRAAAEQGTRLLQEELFPVLDDILSASNEEIAALAEFAGKLMYGVGQTDVGLHYRIHLALLSVARQRGQRDLLIRELYFTAMALYNLETMISPNELRLYSARIRLYFTESASYFDTAYDEITDPETRGYIHRSMGNIALSYDGRDPASAKAKLEAITRSINILSDPDIRAKTPSLPWDLYLYKSHQERTTLLNFLRSGLAGPDAFAQVLESAQIVQDRQQRAARDQGVPLQPRWQYAYMAARYHCGAMLLPELLDGLYGLSVACPDGDQTVAGMFSLVSVPALYMEYSRQLRDEQQADHLAERITRMTKRMFAWLVQAPSDENNGMLMFYCRQFLYAYREVAGGLPFFEVLQNVFAARHAAVYARLWIAGQAARQLTLWAVEDCPERLAGLPGCETAGDVIWRRDALAEFANRAGRLYDTGMVHFIDLDVSACRGLFEEEEALLQLHAHCGAELLSLHPSTRIFADIARGHHRWYNEKGGYPLGFSLRESPVRPMVFIVAAADALTTCAEECATRYRPMRAYDEICDEIAAQAGKHYAPFVAGLLAPPERREELRRKLEGWRHEAYVDMYRRREQMLL